jgi:CTP:molybdopterin cytidylyltransferase MocA
MHGQYSEVLNQLAVVAFVAYSNERAAERAPDAARRTAKTTNGAARGLAASVAAALRRLRTAGAGIGVARVRSR